MLRQALDLNELPDLHVQIQSSKTMFEQRSWVRVTQQSTFTAKTQDLVWEAPKLLFFLLFLTEIFPKGTSY